MALFTYVLGLFLCFAQANSYFWLQNGNIEPIKCFNELNSEGCLPNLRFCTEQEIIHGQCPGYENISPKFINKYAIQVPENCEKGQRYINFECRYIWTSEESNDTQNLEDSIIPPLINGQMGRRKRQTSNGKQKDSFLKNRRITSVPYQCPSGYRADALKVCRKKFDVKKSR